MHLVINFIGPADGEGINVYKDRVLHGKDETKTDSSRFRGDGRIIIGKNLDEGYARVDVEEPMLLNQYLTSFQMYSLVLQTAEVIY